MTIVVALLALGPLAATATAAGAHAGAGPSAHAAKKKCKKAKKRAASVAKKKCKKKPAAPVTATPPAGGGSTPPPPPPPDTRTTDQKIDDAVASGAITAEQGLEYKVFAAFKDPRLPGQYVGVPDALAEAPLDQVIAQWNELSDGAKATLGPFLIPPMHEGSYWEQLINGTAPAATSSPALASARAAAADPDSPWCFGTQPVADFDWSFVEADSGPPAGKVRIWYQNRYAGTDAALAADLMNALEQKIWGALATLMQREPLPDGGSVEPCAGGTDAVDIALVDADTATTSSKTLFGENTAARMVFPRTLPADWAGFKPYLAHEVMHMIQYSYSFAIGNMTTGDNQWLREGTAQWVQDYISSDKYGIKVEPDQTEHKALKRFFPNPEESLDSTATYKHDYGSYVFWFWATRKGNDPTLVRQVWNAVAAKKSLEAAKSLFASGWPQAWKDFTKANWNKDPIGDYQDWDDINDTPTIAAEGNLPHNEITPVNTLVKPVAAKYLRFVPKPEVGTLIFRNNGTVSDDAGIQAIIKYKDGSTAEEDWSQITQQDVPFCAIEELVLVLSNASITPSDSKFFTLTFGPPASGPHASVSPRAANVCVPNPQGSFSGTAHYDDTVADILDWTWSGNVVFEANGQVNAWFPDFDTEVWDNATVKSGSVTMSASGTVTGSEQTCEIDVPAQSFTLGPGDGSSMIIQPGPEPHYGIQLFGPPIVQGNLSCPDGTSGTASFPAPGLIYTPDPEQTTTRGSYAGSSTFGNEFFQVNFNWNLADPQPAP